MSKFFITANGSHALRRSGRSVSDQHRFASKGDVIGRAARTRTPPFVGAIIETGHAIHGCMAACLDNEKVLLPCFSHGIQYGVSGRSGLFVFEVKGAAVKGLNCAKNDVALFTKNNLIKGVANSNNVLIFDYTKTNTL